MTTAVERKKSRHSNAGRPRSEKSHQAILKATLELLARNGLQGTSIEAVAEKAGVGKSTIYRRWSDKEELALAALEELQARRSTKMTGNLRQDLLFAFREFERTIGKESVNYLDLFVRLFGESRETPEMLSTMMQKTFEPRIKMFSQMIEQAKAKEEVRQDVDFRVLLSLMGGAFIYYRFISRLLQNWTPPADLPEQIIDVIFNGISGRREK